MQMRAHANALPLGVRMQEVVAPAAAQAVRPSAASARPHWFVAGSALRPEPAWGIEENACWVAHCILERDDKPMFGKARVVLCKVTACSEPRQALRRSTKPNTRGRAGTSCFAARAGGVRLLASDTTQRTMQAGSAPHAMPNPSIERDAQRLAPLGAPHVKR